ncbi:MAG: nucleotidyltransferase family protein [Candidatus Thiodiazotropha sp. (ex Lucinoma borealis)]|nr:nucleotidyltransferase family protein [Candidatus Thiodiazotropha sp. (ex Lucinoma borealis)]MCU7855901.1 nucleotidyltransferase family protein [Candidatus Thiodiazotropha sp. (ex Lucinoma borealis)]MCU7870832.1 nucleotidyltransferase family protein [Candidatus Thiodiazotropha sp. (ex Lucinoma borealis)]
MKAMILAAGRGERMRPLTDKLPKPLLPVAGKPLIVHHIERLAAAGYCELVINHAHMGKMIEARLGKGSTWGVDIQYSSEEVALETGGGIYRALPLLGDEPFLVVNGDVWCEIDFSNLHLSHGDLAHLVLVPNPSHHQQGDFQLQQGRVKQGNDDLLTFSGVGIYHPHLFESCAPVVFPLGPLLRDAMDKGFVSGVSFTGLWMDVGTPQRLMLLERIIQHNLSANG